MKGYHLYKNAKFCNFCGTKLAQEEYGSFDPDTGKPLTWGYCPNTNCVSGCGSTDEGHHWVSQGFLFNRTKHCTRCGKETVRINPF